MELRALPFFSLLKYKVPTFKFKQFSASKGGAELGVQGGGGANTPNLVNVHVAQSIRVHVKWIQGAPVQREECSRR